MLTSRRPGTVRRFRPWSAGPIAQGDYFGQAGGPARRRHAVPPSSRAPAATPVLPVLPVAAAPVPPRCRCRRCPVPRRAGPGVLPVGRTARCRTLLLPEPLPLPVPVPVPVPPHSPLPPPPRGRTTRSGRDRNGRRRRHGRRCRGRRRRSLWSWWSRGRRARPARGRGGGARPDHGQGGCGRGRARWRRLAASRRCPCGRRGDARWTRCRSRRRSSPAAPHPREPELAAGGVPGPARRQGRDLAANWGVPVGPEPRFSPATIDSAAAARAAARRAGCGRSTAWLP